jgi:hypothetical protein
MIGDWTGSLDVTEAPLPSDRFNQNLADIYVSREHQETLVAAFKKVADVLAVENPAIATLERTQNPNSDTLRRDWNRALANARSDLGRGMIEASRLSPDAPPEPETP